MRRALISVLVLTAASQAYAADREAGKRKAEVCAACHGMNGVSVSAEIPNLAGQKAKYISLQLKAFKGGKRKNALMNAIATQLGDADIDNLAAFFSGLPGASGGATSEMPAKVAKTRVRFPDTYKTTFTTYTRINFPKKKQVRTYYANPVALQAAREGKPMPDGAMFFVEVYKTKLDAEKKPVMGNDGFLVADKLAAYTAMEMQPGWGKDIPEILRNGDWNYAVFTADKKLKAGVNQAKCFACHKPLTDTSYVFSLKKLQEKARMKN
ncbi:MAG: cytochrome P460 family protein [Methyloligellaceae bacterium]